MKKTIGMLVLMISAASVMVPAAAARDRDDNYYGARDQAAYSYSYNARVDDHGDRDRYDHDRKYADRGDQDHDRDARNNSRFQFDYRR